MNKKLLAKILCSAFFLYFFSNSAFALLFNMPAPYNDLVGDNFYATVQNGDTVHTIRTRYELSIHELAEANSGVDFQKLRVGQKLLITHQIILPPYRRGIVINMAELRLYYFTPDGEHVFTTAVGMGRPDWRTPTTITKVVRKDADPIWYVPDSIREYTLAVKGHLLPDAVMPGPENPLGKFALYLQRRGYLIHGTNQPDSVGTFASSGCMRLWADAIELLYETVALGTPVHILHHANKAGWLGNRLYLETQRPVSINEQPTVLNSVEAEDAIAAATKYRPAIIDWDMVRKVASAKLGVPTIVGVAK